MIFLVGFIVFVLANVCLDDFGFVGPFILAIKKGNCAGVADSFSFGLII